MSRSGSPRRGAVPAPSGRDRHRDRRRVADGGFSLIEVVVAIGLVGLLVAVVLPAVVLGIRSNAIATTNTQARGLAQAEMERMRNLPFHIARNAGEFVDVLDYYFPTTTAAAAVSCRTDDRWTVPTTSWRGYVTSTAATARCAWEPPTGPFYRQVRREGRFTVVTATQFLTNATPPTVVTPAPGYRNVGTVATGQDSPPALQVAARVTVFANDLGTREPVSSSTQIGRRDLTSTRVASSVDVTAIEVGTTTKDGLPLTLAIGSVDLGAEVTTTSEARATLAAALTGLGTGQQAGGAQLSAEAPADGSAAAASLSGGVLDPAQGCFLACWGGTSQGGATLTTADGLPNVGSPTSPVLTSLDDLSNAGFALGQGSNPGYRSDLELRNRLVRVDTGPGVKTGVTTTCTAAESGSVVRARSGGWLRTTDPGPSNNGLVEACGVARTAPISILPTTFAPDGVLRVSLETARASCTVSGPSHSATASAAFRAVVEYYNGSTMAPLAVIHRGTSGPSDPALPTSLNGLDLTSYSLGAGNGTLADYVASWSSVGSSDLVEASAAGRARVSVPGIVRINSVPLRPAGPAPGPATGPTTVPSPSPSSTSAPTDALTPTSGATSPSPSSGPTSSSSPTATATTDPLSTLTVSLGALSCSAEDTR